MAGDGPREQQAEARRLERALIDLLALEREIVELAYVRRSDSLERVRDAIRRLGEIGSSQGILSRAAEELGGSSQFDRVLISEVAERVLRPAAIWCGHDPAGAAAAITALKDSPITLEYPLIEDEVASHHRVEIVDVGSSRGRAAPRLAAVLGWDSYVVAAIAVRGQTVGILHADAALADRPLDLVDAEVAGSFAEGLSGVYERAVLRETLQLHREELQSAVRWMSGRLSRLAAEAADWTAPATARRRRSGSPTS